MTWTVLITRKANKQLEKLPVKIQDVLARLMRDIELQGPVRGDWSNYSKLGPNQHHCHLNKQGRPTYVACWEVMSKEIKMVEVYHVSTREKAPY